LVCVFAFCLSTLRPGKKERTLALSVLTLVASQAPYLQTNIDGGGGGGGGGGVCVCVCVCVGGVG
jgi:hypothetical protein